MLKGPPKGFGMIKTVKRGAQSVQRTTKWFKSPARDRTSTQKTLQKFSKWVRAPPAKERSQAQKMFKKSSTTYLDTTPNDNAIENLDIEKGATSDEEMEIINEETIAHI